jgi:serine/threonine protein kinase
VLYELAALTPPFVAPDMERLFQAVTTGVFERLPQYSNNLNRIIKLLLQTNPVKRPSCSQILSLKVVVNYK